MVVNAAANNIYYLKGIKIYKIEAKNFWILILKASFIALKEFWNKM